MGARQTLPTRWLMTDERLRERLFDAIDRLPAGAGIVFRHYSLMEEERRSLFRLVRARRADTKLLLAGPAEQALAWGADGSHGRGAGPGLRTAPAHDLAEIRAAEEAGAALVFLSPVYPTRSHPGGPVLGPDGFDALASQTKLPAVALGGMNAARFALLENAYGWAGIGAWIKDQKRNAVPI